MYLRLVHISFSLNTIAPLSVPKMRLTLRKYLSLPNPAVNTPENYASKPRDVPTWSDVPSWTPWEDFSNQNVNFFLGRFLDREFDLPEPAPLLPVHLDVKNERGLDFVVTRWQNIVVNAALDIICCELGLENVAWTVGWKTTKSDRDILSPDWAAVTPAFLRDDLLPGDSKITNIPFYHQYVQLNHPMELDSHQIAIETKQRPAEYMKACLSQSTFYASCWKSRYSYIITNMELILIRIRRGLPPTPRVRASRQTNPVLPSSPPIQAGVSLGPMPRPPNLRSLPTTSTPESRKVRNGQNATPGSRVSPSLPAMPQTTPDQSPKHLSNFEFTSPLTANPQFTSSFSVHQPTSSAYTDDGHEDFELADPEIVTIPWGNKDLHGGVTMNIALVLIHLLASISNEIRDTYLPINEDPDYQCLRST